MSNLRIPRPWERIPESQVTPEERYLNRRDALKQLGVAGVGLAGLIAGSNHPLAARPPQLGPYGHVPAQWAEKWSSFFPVARNETYRVVKPVTQEKLFAGYNNFYEFSLKKDQVKDLVSDFRVHPWEVEIKGEVEKKGKYDLDDLIRMGELEDRVYRHRCVEAWSAVVPWKYGFKGIKSIVKIEFKKKQPGTFWDKFSREYGFYGNINPRFNHPRWSQASEIFLNTRERVPTQLYNGYGEFVGQMYDENNRKYFY